MPFIRRGCSVADLRKNIGIVLFLATFLACQVHVKKKNTPEGELSPPEPKPSTQAPLQPQGPSSGWALQIFGGDKPFEYYIQPHFNEEYCENSKCFFALAGKDEKEFSKVFDPTVHPRVLVMAGASYRIALLKASTLEILEESEVTLPTDLLLSGNMDLRVPAPSGEYLFETTGRIFLTQDLVMITGPSNVTLKGSELIVASPTNIINFQESETAAVGENGKNGGLLTLQFELATGQLELLLSGQNGGSGEDKPDLTYNKGKKPDGLPAIIEGDWINPPGGGINFGSRLVEVCRQPATAGESGTLSGDPSVLGGNGGHGGNTGRLLWGIKHFTDFKLNLKYRPGVGGRNGLGGQGSYGELGGKGGGHSYLAYGKSYTLEDFYKNPPPYHADTIFPSKKILAEKCRIYPFAPQMGSDGVRGPKGVDGNPGHDGAISETYSLSQ